MSATRRKRERLVGPLALILLVGAIVAVLAALFSRSESLDSLDNLSAVDAVSLAYLRVRVRANPNDQRARLLLGRHALHIGNLDEGWQTLHPLLERDGAIAEQARHLAVELRLIEWRATKIGSSERVRAAAELRRALARTTADHPTVPNLERYIQIYGELGDPGAAARLSSRLAELAPTQKVRYLMQAGAAYLQAAQPREAAVALARAALVAEGPEEVLAVTLKAIDAYRAAADPAHALALVDKLLEKWPGDASLLKRGVDIALSAGDLRRALAWVQKWAALVPRDVTALQTQLRIELALAHVPKAYQLARALVALRPQDMVVRKQLAKLAQWSAHLEVALDSYLQLARQGDRQALAEASRLAHALSNPDATVELLELQLQHGPVSSELLQELVAACEAIGAPARAAQLLRTRLQQVPTDSNALQLLAGLLERMGELRASVSLWERIATGPAPRVADVTKVAEVLWRLHRPAKAIERLLQVEALATSSDVDYWSMVGDLAWGTDARDLAARALKMLARHAPLGAEQLERLVQLKQDDPEELLALGVEGWTRFRRARMLLLAMDAALRLERWGRLAELMREAEASPGLLADEMQYWLIRAQLAIHRRQPRAAMLDYGQALRLQPRSVAARTGVLWLLISINDRPQLAQLVDGWRGDARYDPLYWAVYGAALDRLGKPTEALEWYGRAVRDQPADDVLMASWGDALAHAGWPVARHRVREFLLARLPPKLLAARAQSATTHSKQLRLLYADLVRELRGPEAAQRVLRTSASSDRESDAEAVSRALEDDRIDEAEWQAGRLVRRGGSLGVAQRLALALKENDLATVRELLAQRSERLPPELRMEAQQRLGNEDAALGVAAEVLVSPHSTPEERAVAVAQQRMHRESNPSSIDATVRVDALGSGLTVERNEARLALRLSSRLALDLAPAVSVLSSSDFAVADHDVEAQAEAGLSVRLSRSVTRMAAGFHWRADSTLAQGRLTEMLTIGRRVSLRGELAINEITNESAAFRLVGARSQMGLSLHVDVTRRDTLVVTIDAQQHRTRGFELLAQGGTVEAELAHLLLHAPELRVRLLGGYARHDLVAALPASAAALLPAGTTVAAVLAPEVGWAALGATFAQSLRVLTLDAGVQLGWMGLPNRFAYHVHLGLRVPLGRGEITLAGYVANDATSGLGQSYVGAQLGYTLKFGS